MTKIPNGPFPELKD